MLDTFVPAGPQTLTDPLVAWRTWTLSGTPDGSEVRLLPLFGDRRFRRILGMMHNRIEHHIADQTDFILGHAFVA